MKTLNKLIILLLLSGFYSSSFAAVGDIDMPSCSVFSEGDKKDKGKEKGSEDDEPDCE